MNISEQVTFLENLLDKDQKSRFKVNESSSPEEKKSLVLAMMEQDKDNLKSFLDYLNEYGWPEISTHGEKPSSAAFFILQHSNLELMEEYHPILEEKAQKGEAKPHHAAMMEDRILMMRGKKQKYGSQAWGEPAAAILSIYPIEDVDQVNVRRAKAGFPTTIEEHAAWANFIFDPNENI